VSANAPAIAGQALPVRLAIGSGDGNLQPDDTRAAKRQRRAGMAVNSVGILSALLMVCHAGYAIAADPPSEARLIADVQSIQPGVPFRAGVLITMRDNWHTYWLNPGDSGMRRTCAGNSRTIQGRSAALAGPAHIRGAAFLQLRVRTRRSPVQGNRATQESGRGHELHIRCLGLLAGLQPGVCAPEQPDAAGACLAA